MAKSCSTKQALHPVSLREDWQGLPSAKPFAADVFFQPAIREAGLNSVTWFVHDGRRMDRQIDVGHRAIIQIQHRQPLCSRNHDENTLLSFTRLQHA